MKNNGDDVAARAGLKKVMLIGQNSPGDSVIIIIIISQTATPLVKANSYKPEGTSRESSPVRKGKRQKIGDK